MAGLSWGIELSSSSYLFDVFSFWSIIVGGVCSGLIAILDSQALRPKYYLVGGSVSGLFFAVIELIQSGSLVGATFYHVINDLFRIFIPIFGAVFVVGSIVAAVRYKLNNRTHQ